LHSGRFTMWRMSTTGTVESAEIPGTNSTMSCMCAPLTPLNGRLFFVMVSDETGSEFAWLDEPTWVMPATDRTATPWGSALVLLSALTAAAGLTIRVRAIKQ